MTTPYTEAREPRHICPSENETDNCCDSIRSCKRVHEENMPTSTSTAELEAIVDDTCEDSIQGDRPCTRSREGDIDTSLPCDRVHDDDMPTSTGTVELEAVTDNTHEDLIQGDRPCKNSREGDIDTSLPCERVHKDDMPTSTGKAELEAVADDTHEDLIQGNWPYKHSREGDIDTSWPCERAHEDGIPTSTSTAELEARVDHTHGDLIVGNRPCERVHQGDMSTSAHTALMELINSLQDPIEGDDEEIPYRPIGRLSQIVPQNPKKNDYRTLKRQVFEKRVTKGMMRKVLALNNMEAGITSFTPALLSILEQLFGLQDVQWPTDWDRLSIIAEKIDLALRSLLRLYG